MDIRDLRKFIFINSQSCTYYIDQKDTVIAGLFRNIGYKYSGRLDEDVILQFEKKYRDIITGLNYTFAFELLLYVYLFVFPLYTKIMILPFFLAIAVLALIPLVALYITNFIFNKKYEAFLNESIGEYEIVKFKPNIYNIEPAAFDRYLKTPRKSIYAMILVLIIFIIYAFTPMYIDSLNMKDKFNKAIKISNIYIMFVPINSDVYAQKAYANYRLENYNDAVKNYELANKYSFSDSFDFEILGSKVVSMSKEDAIAEFDKNINSKEEEQFKYYLKSQKALYLQQNKDYKEALKIYNELITKYEKEKIDSFEADLVYFNRGVVRSLLGDVKGADADKKKARVMCSECSFEPKLSLVKQP